MKAPNPVICVFCPGTGAQAGGIGRCIGYLQVALQDYPSTPVIIILDSRGNGSVHKSPLHAFAAAVRLLSLHATRGVALAHINVASNASVFRKAFIMVWCKALNIPTVVHLHGGEFDEFYGSACAPVRRLVRWLFGTADRTVALGPSWERFITRDIGIRPPKLVTICNGVPQPTGTKQATEEPHIIFVGRLGFRKGTRDLITALADVRLAGLPWKATIAGDGDVELFRTQAVEMGIGHRVSFTGWISGEDIQSLLSRTDIFVLPSYHEALPVAAIEAMAWRIPIIVTSVGSLQDYVEDGVSCRMLDAGDVSGLSDAIIQLVSCADTRAALGEAGLAVYRTHFDLRTTSSQMLSVYRDIARHRLPHLGLGNDDVVTATDGD